MTNNKKITFTKDSTKLERSTKGSTKDDIKKQPIDYSKEPVPDLIPKNNDTKKK